MSIGRSVGRGSFDCLGKDIMNESLIEWIPFARIVTVLAIVFGISLGLCGVTFVFGTGSSAGAGSWIGFGILGLVALGVSLAGLLLTLLVFVALKIFERFRRRG